MTEYYIIFLEKQMSTIYQHVFSHSTSRQIYKQVYNQFYLIPMNDFSKMWQTALVEIETAVSQANFSTWFKETAILRQEEGTIYLGVPNSFTQEWLQKKFHNSILRILRQMNNHVRALEYGIVKDTDKKAEENYIRFTKKKK